MRAMPMLSVEVLVVSENPAESAANPIMDASDAAIPKGGGNLASFVGEKPALRK